MSELAIEIDRVSRMFKRYRHPRYQVLEALGLRAPAKSYDEFWALRDISITMRRGDRLGIIGRNGAGKSTLLSIVCGRLQPTSGTVRVRGRIQALMELGTGFHPELTGRENVLTSLAYQGVTGRKAQGLLEEIFDFAELDDFIDQPVKTYSTGMYTRLAFTTSTALEPDVLIIDEVMGAGDAYFAAKSTDRMYRLTVETGATVLFVSHDISAVQRLCNAAVWIDRGQIKMQGSALHVAKSYYADVAIREEARLRARTTVAIARMQRKQNGGASDPARLQFRFRLVTADGQPPRLSHPIRRVTMITSDGRRFEVSPGAPMDNQETQAAFIATDSSEYMWSRPKRVRGELVRSFEATGGKAAEAPIWVQDASGIGAVAQYIEIEHAIEANEPIAIDFHTPIGYQRIGLLTPPAPGQSWRSERFRILDGDSEAVALSAPGLARISPVTDQRPDDAAADRPFRDKWESNEGRFTDIASCNLQTHERQHVFRLGEPVTFRIGVELFVPLSACWLACQMFDALGNRVSLLIHEFKQGLEAGASEVLLCLDKPNLRQGEYVVTFELLPLFDYHWSEPHRIPYLCLWDRCVFFKVDENYHGSIALGLVSLSSSVSTRRLVQPAVRTLGRDAAQVSR